MAVLTWGTTYGNTIIDHMLRGQAYTVPTTIYLSLHTADPGTTGASEVTGGSYARQAMALNAAANKVTANTAAESFTGMPAATVTHVGIWDSLTTGIFICGGALVSSQAVGAGNTFTIATGDLDLEID
jgi:hypothetical protein